MYLLVKIKEGVTPLSVVEYMDITDFKSQVENAAGNLNKYNKDKTTWYCVFNMTTEELVVELNKTIVV